MQENQAKLLELNIHPPRMKTSCFWFVLDEESLAGAQATEKSRQAALMQSHFVNEITNEGTACLDNMVSLNTKLRGRKNQGKTLCELILSFKISPYDSRPVFLMTDPVWNNSARSVITFHPKNCGNCTKSNDCTNSNNAT